MKIKTWLGSFFSDEKPEHIEILLNPERNGWYMFDNDAASDAEREIIDDQNWTWIGTTKAKYIRAGEPQVDADVFFYKLYVYGKQRMALVSIERGRANPFKHPFFEQTIYPWLETGDTNFIAKTLEVSNKDWWNEHCGVKSPKIEKQKDNIVKLSFDKKD